MREGFIMRWALLMYWLAGTILCAGLVPWCPAPAQQSPAKSAGGPPQTEAQRRQAKRPRPLRIQTSLEQARQTTVEFRQPVERAYKDFNDLVLQTGKFASRHAAQVNVPGTFELLCYNGLPVGPTIRVRRG